MPRGLSGAGEPTSAHRILQEMHNPAYKARLKQHALQLFRYGIVGLATNFAGYLLYLIITYFGVPPKGAISILYPLGATIGFFGNRKWTFDYQGGQATVVMKYVLAHGFGYILNFLILHVGVNLWGYPHQGVQAIAILIVTGFLFVSFKYFVFASSRNIIGGNQ